MLSLFNPSVIVGIMLAIAASFAIGHHEGYAKRDAEMQAQIAKMNDEARDKERAMQYAANNTANNLRKANQDAQDQLARLNALADAGSLRLPTSCVQAGTNAGATSGAIDEARAQSERQTVKDLVAIAADGDNAIRKFNACVDIYNQVKGQQ
jgi:Tfp pilus assembly protein PilE